MNITNTNDLGKVVLFYALHSIAKNGNRMQSRAVTEAVLADLKNSNPPQWVYESVREGGFPQWKSCLHFHSLPAKEYGWLVKNDGFWELTETGQEEMQKWQTIEAFVDAVKSEERRRRKTASQGKAKGDAEDIVADGDDNSSDNSALAQKELDIEAKKGEAREEMNTFIENMDDYTFQCLVAALLRGMGYHVSYVSPRYTPDGGIDIKAHKDLAGFALKVEVKHQKNPISAPDVDRLRGILGPQDIGVFVSSSGFVRGLEKKCREDKGSRIELIDLDRFLDLWRKHYPNMSEKDQAMMHMERIYFLTGKSADGDTGKE